MWEDKRGVKRHFQGKAIQGTIQLKNGSELRVCGIMISKYASVCICALNPNRMVEKYRILPFRFCLFVSHHLITMD